MCFEEHHHESEHIPCRIREITCKSYTDERSITRRHYFIPTRMAKIKNADQIPAHKSNDKQNEK